MVKGINIYPLKHKRKKKKEKKKKISLDGFFRCFFFGGGVCFLRGISAANPAFTHNYLIPFENKYDLYFLVLFCLLPDFLLLVCQ